MPFVGTCPACEGFFTRSLRSRRLKGGRLTDFPQADRMLPELDKQSGFLLALPCETIHKVAASSR